MGSKGKSFRIDKIIANLTDILKKKIKIVWKFNSGQISIYKWKKIYSFHSSNMARSYYVFAYLEYCVT